MYQSIFFFDNSLKVGEKRANPKNLAITPSMICRLTSEGKTTSMHQLDGCLFYPNIADGVLPLEYTRGVDENICWEESQKSSRKIKAFMKHKAEQPSMNKELQ